MAQREAFSLEVEYIPDTELADLIENTIEDAMGNSERSRWSSSHKIGVSDVGHCREYMRRMISGIPFSDEEPDRMAAFVGTAVGDLLEAKMQDEWKTQQLVVVPLTVETPGGPVVLNLPGHPDAYKRDRVLDFKTTYSLEVKEKYGPTLQQKFQPTLYANALINAGEVDDDCMVSLVYLDRSARRGARPVVYSWRYDERIVRAARDWLGDVFESLVLGTEAPRDKEREWCMDWCPFASDCRREDSDVQGLILDQEIATAAEVYLQAQAEEKAARVRKDQAKTVLEGKSGHTRAGVQLRTVTVPPTFVEGGWRKEYSRLSVSPGKTGREKNGAQPS